MILVGIFEAGKNAPNKGSTESITVNYLIANYKIMFNEFKQFGTFFREINCHQKKLVILSNPDIRLYKKRLQVFRVVELKFRRYIYS